jgi:prepilin-type processing-associated H-X9-DG protein
MVVAILAAILIPAIGNIRKNAKDVECVANLRRWGQVVLLYTMENGGHYAVRGLDPRPNPSDPWESWASTQGPYRPYFGDTSHGVRQARKCPGCSLNHDGTTYGMSVPQLRDSSSVSVNTFPPAEQIPLFMATMPSNLLLIFDAPPSSSGMMRRGFSKWQEITSTVAGAEAESTMEKIASPPYPRHKGGINALFADGHVRRVHWEPRTPDDPDSFVAQQNVWFILNP